MSNIDVYVINALLVLLVLRQIREHPLDLRSLAIADLVSPFSDEIHFGERVGVIGPNGSGKTALMSVLAGNREPDAGELQEMGAYAMAATVDFGLEAKQGLLDLRSENARLRLVTRLFHAAATRLDLV